MITRWEYRTLTIDVAQGMFTESGVVDEDALTSMLNVAGNEGWELVSALDTTVQGGRSRFVVMLLKRPRR
jgi:hypothetical protein